MKNKLHDINIAGIAAALPASVCDLREMAEIYGREDTERIIASTGIQKVRIAPENICASDLCQEAARTLINQLNLQRKDIDGLVFLSQTPDWPLPSTACALQDRLGLEKKTVTMDIACGCSAYIYGLFQAGLLIQTGTCERVLVCAGDVISRFINQRDKAVKMVFGDAGSATIVEKSSHGNQWPFVLYSDGAGGDHLKVEAGGARLPRSAGTAVEKKYAGDNCRSSENLYMNGMEILNFSLREVPPAIAEIRRMQGWQPTDPEAEVVILHQANKFMVDYLRRKMRLGSETVPVAVAETGNTGPASIPLTLSLCYQRLRRQNQLSRTIMCGFGAGLSWGATAGDLSNTRILSPIEFEL